VERAVCCEPCLACGLKVRVYVCVCVYVCVSALEGWADVYMGAGVGMWWVVQGSGAIEIGRYTMRLSV
jgi:hypothetical protein